LGKKKRGPGHARDVKIEKKRSGEIHTESVATRSSAEPLGQSSEGTRRKKKKRCKEKKENERESGKSKATLHALKEKK